LHRKNSPYTRGGWQAGQSREASSIFECQKENPSVGTWKMHVNNKVVFIGCKRLGKNIVLNDLPKTI
jgi:hypothetical protein